MYPLCSRFFEAKNASEMTRFWWWGNTLNFLEICKIFVIIGVNKKYPFPLPSWKICLNSHTLTLVNVSGDPWGRSWHHNNPVVHSLQDPMKFLVMSFVYPGSKCVYFLAYVDLKRSNKIKHRRYSVDTAHLLVWIKWGFTYKVKCWCHTFDGVDKMEIYIKGIVLMLHNCWCG
jgi:hypothetical protein